MAELKTLGRYTLERVLGKGAMGVVYEATDPRLERRVAVKAILKSSLDEATAKDFAQRFVREAQAVARLNHPNIVQVHDFGEEGDIAYLVMELVRGKELKTCFDASERFSLNGSVRMMCELLEALEFAHQAGVIHRDIKPANVMLDPSGRTKLTDFGVALMQGTGRTHGSQGGTMVGTPAYMSPEQISGGIVDGRSDVFSAAIILYQFLTGEQPFTGGGVWTVAKKIMQEHPLPPSSLNPAVTVPFDGLVSKALAKSPEERFQSARAFSNALRNALEGRHLEDDAESTVALPRPAASAAIAEIGGATASTQDAEVEFWRSIKDGNSAEDFELYIDQFPNGIYVKLAQLRIARLRGVASEESGPRKQEQEEQEAREREEAAQREAEATEKAVQRARLAAGKTRQEALAARKEAELIRSQAAARGRPAPMTPVLAAGLGVAILRNPALGPSVPQSAPPAAEPGKTQATQAELQKDAELARQREIEARQLSEAAKQKEREDQAKKAAERPEDAVESAPDGAGNLNDKP